MSHYIFLYYSVLRCTTLLLLRFVLLHFILYCYTLYIHIYIQDVKKLRLQRFRDDRGGKNKDDFYLTKLWLMHRFAARWSYG